MGQMKNQYLEQLDNERLLDAMDGVTIYVLTMGGKPVGADEARKLVLDPEYQPLADLIIEAVSAVDNTRANREAELVKN